jgi:hypothetical protein
MQPAKLCRVGLIALAAVVSTPAHADYVVDFRARPGGVFGHTYVVYGQLDGRGRLLRPRYAGLYPGSEFPPSPLLAIFAVPGKVGIDRDDRKRPPSIIYRRRLSPAIFNRLAGLVQRQRRRPQLWDLLFYNCNTFAAEIAKSVGLRTPSTLELPPDFVRGLYFMNRSHEAERDKIPAPTGSRHRASADRDALIPFP